jgi:hypothetical protein
MRANGGQFTNRAPVQGCVSPLICAFDAKESRKVDVPSDWHDATVQDAYKVL